MWKWQVFTKNNNHMDVTLNTLVFQVVEHCKFWQPSQKLKGFSSSTKLFAIGITIVAKMAIVNNHVNSLHNLQDLNNKIIDLVRFFFMCSFINVFYCNEIVNDLETLLQALHPCLQLLCRYQRFFTFTSYFIMTKLTMSGANHVCSLITHVHFRSFYNRWNVLLHLF